ncbi:hypothetical protein [Saccharothrix luteola]|uniref:hypothetical protein n=1 Tax=Saccharothrix luteola TaxID=2893018 RepID=UPI001E46F884|nr:hypothetical protein [Saccharothrix luteola]MCC8251591.1 hypothetical protein [Saccharothrix luteola]
MIKAKRYADLGNAVLPRLVLAAMMASGELDRHLRFVRRRHRRRRDAMIAAIARHLPDAVVHGAAAGLHLLITFDDGRGTRDDPGDQDWVLGYGASTPTDIAEGVAVIADVRRQS